MTIMPREASWVAYGLLLVFLTAATVAIMVLDPGTIVDCARRLWREFVHKVEAS